MRKKYLCLSQKEYERVFVIKAYSLIHRNRGRKPKPALPKELKDKVVRIVKEKYLNYNFEHIRDLLEEREE